MGDASKPINKDAVRTCCNVGWSFAVMDRLSEGVVSCTFSRYLLGSAFNQELSDDWCPLT